MGNLDLMAVTLTYKVSNKDKIIGCKKQKVKKKLLLTLRALQVDWELVTSSSAFPALAVLRLLSNTV